MSKARGISLFGLVAVVCLMQNCDVFRIAAPPDGGPSFERATRSELSPTSLEKMKSFARAKLRDAALPPFSFRYGGQSIATLLPSWSARTTLLHEDEHRTSTQTLYAEPGGPLEIRVVVDEFKKFAVVEYRIFLRNRGPVSSARIQDVRTLLDFGPPGPSEPLLHYAAGNSDLETHGDDQPFMDFQPLSAPIPAGRWLDLAPMGGRSSDTVLPFFNLQRGEDEGVIAALGWTGHWRASFIAGESLRMSYGLMDATDLVLKAGEPELSLPSMTLSFWTGDRIGDTISSGGSSCAIFLRFLGARVFRWRRPRRTAPSRMRSMRRP